jgi:hypothetical protein
LATHEVHGTAAKKCRKGGKGVRTRGLSWRNGGVATPFTPPRSQVVDRSCTPARSAPCCLFEFSAEQKLGKLPNPTRNLPSRLRSVGPVWPPQIDASLLIVHGRHAPGEPYRTCKVSMTFRANPPG